MNQIYDFKIMYRMNRIDFIQEFYHYQHNMKIKRCSINLDMLISNITDGQKYELFL